VIFAGATAVVALGLDDGHELWRAEAENVSALAADDAVVLVGERGSVRSLDPATGREQWTITLTGQPTSIVARAGWVIATAGPTIGAFRANNGTTIWQQALGADINASPSIDGDGLFVTLADGRLLRLDMATGDVRWTTLLDAASGGVLAANDLVYVGESDGGFRALRQSNGEDAWRKQFRAETIGTPVSDSDHVYAAVLDNTVRALDRHTGNERWVTQLVTRPGGGPMVTAEGLLIPSATGEVGLNRFKDGRTMARLPLPTKPATDSPGAEPRLVGFTAVGPNAILRLMANADGTLTLTRYRKTPPKPKKGPAAAFTAAPDPRRW
jgi:outer membrane protein assembly factor BamB